MTNLLRWVLRTPLHGLMASQKYGDGQILLRRYMFVVGGNITRRTFTKHADSRLWPAEKLKLVASKKRCGRKTKRVAGTSMCRNKPISYEATHKRWFECNTCEGYMNQSKMMLNKPYCVGNKQYFGKKTDFIFKPLFSRYHDWFQSGKKFETTITCLSPSTPIDFPGALRCWGTNSPFPQFDVPLVNLG
jgi:hypothetical protein